ncbi:hypothetical protein GCM10010423_62700 [Streptomyces levis]|uniref:Uncharacterized protein n=1 Tax=Streptomyces levis TaxID=285566 RepID=A0ABN3P1R2_9ACTN
MVVDGPLPGFHPAPKDALTFPPAWGRYTGRRRATVTTASA